MGAHVWIWDSLRGVLETFALRPRATDPPATFYNTLLLLLLLFFQLINFYSFFLLFGPTCKTLLSSLESALMPKGKLVVLS